MALNMQRGFQRSASRRPSWPPSRSAQALQKAGMTLVMKVGGASGPLYGSLLMAMGKAAPGDAVDGGVLAAMLAAGIEAVKARGKSDAGEKTMLDVLVPAQRALQRPSPPARPRGDAAARVRAAAEQRPRMRPSDEGDEGPRLVPGRALRRPSRSGRPLELRC